MPHHGPNEVSAGGVLARRTETAWEICLVCANGYWGFPKGHIEGDETPAEAALREISEECGLPRDSLAIVAEMAPSEYVYRRGGRLIFKLVHQFVVTTDTRLALTPQPSEIEQAQWMSIDEAIARASFADTRAALAAATAVLTAPTA